MAVILLCFETKETILFGKYLYQTNDSEDLNIAFLVRMCPFQIIIEIDIFASWKVIEFDCKPYNRTCR